MDTDHKTYVEEYCSQHGGNDNFDVGNTGNRAKNPRIGYQILHFNDFSKAWCLGKKDPR